MAECPACEDEFEGPTPQAVEQALDEHQATCTGQTLSERFCQIPDCFEPRSAKTPMCRPHRHREVAKARKREQTKARRAARDTERTKD